MIKVEALYKRYGEKEVLKDINFSLQKGERFAIIGPIGAGKSTLLRLINLLEEPSSGYIHFDDLCTKADRLKIRRKMAMVFQRPILFNTTVFDNVAYGLRVRGQKNFAKKVKEALEIVGLSRFEKVHAHTLSSGQMQQVAIARAIVTDPELLLLDEPTAYLDASSKEKIENALSDVINSLKTTTIIVTHDFLQAKRFAHRIGVLIDGRMMQIGDVTQLFNKPADEKVAQFLRIQKYL